MRNLVLGRDTAINCYVFSSYLIIWSLVCWLMIKLRGRSEAGGAGFSCWKAATLNFPSQGCKRCCAVLFRSQISTTLFWCLGLFLLRSVLFLAPDGSFYRLFFYRLAKKNNLQRYFFLFLPATTNTLSLHLRVQQCTVDAITPEAWVLRWKKHCRS